MQNLDLKSLTGITALLVHAAKIDEQYSEQEKKIINRKRHEQIFIANRQEQIKIPTQRKRE